MACSCRGRARDKFVWYNGDDFMVYNTEIEAKAKVMRRGGAYFKSDPNNPIASQIAMHKADAP